jgi:hypothetical protein
VPFPRASDRHMEAIVRAHSWACHNLSPPALDRADLLSSAPAADCGNGLLRLLPRGRGAPRVSMDQQRARPLRTIRASRSYRPVVGGCA